LEVARLKKKGVQEPYVYVDLKSFLPAWADTQPDEEGDASDDEGDELSRGCRKLASVLERGMTGAHVHMHTSGLA